jgi:hypothetical protein
VWLAFLWARTGKLKRAKQSEIGRREIGALFLSPRSPSTDFQRQPMNFIDEISVFVILLINK